MLISFPPRISITQKKSANLHSKLANYAQIGRFDREYDKSTYIDTYLYIIATLDNTLCGGPHSAVVGELPLRPRWQGYAVGVPLLVEESFCGCPGLEVGGRGSGEYRP